MSAFIQQLRSLMAESMACYGNRVERLFLYYVLPLAAYDTAVAVPTWIWPDLQWLATLETAAYLLAAPIVIFVPLNLLSDRAPLVGITAPIVATFFIATLIYWVAIAAGLLLLIFPGLYVMVSVFTYAYPILFRAAGPLDAIGESVEVMLGQRLVTGLILIGWLVVWIVLRTSFQSLAASDELMTFSRVLIEAVQWILLNYLLLYPAALIITLVRRGHGDEAGGYPDSR